MKRDEMVGRAAEQAFKSQKFWDADWSKIGLAAVAEARRIDTCETCKHRHVDGVTTHFHGCRLFQFPTGHIDDVGCNRHEPKEGE